MSILSGFFKTKKYRKTDTGYQLQSEWTSASTVEMADGNTAETNLGDIKGITDSLTATSSNVALSAKGGNNLQGQIDTLNSNLSKGYQLISTKIELLTCTAGQIRKYIFPNLPKHEISLAFVVDASANIVQTNVYRNIYATGEVNVYSPINQDVAVMLVLFGPVVNNE